MEDSRPGDCPTVLPGFILSREGTCNSKTLYFYFEVFVIMLCLIYYKLQTATSEAKMVVTDG